MANLGASNSTVTEKQRVQLEKESLAYWKLKKYDKPSEEIFRKPSEEIIRFVLKSDAVVAELWKARGLLKGDLPEVVGILCWIAQHEPPMAWHPPIRKDALRAARCLRTQALKLTLLTKAFVKLIDTPALDSGSKLRSKLRLLVWYCRPSLVDGRAGQRKQARLLSQKSERLIDLLERRCWKEVVGKDLTWLAEGLEACSPRDVRQSPYEMELLLMKTLDDAGLRKPHVAATHLINAVHGSGTRCRRESRGREAPGVELRSPDLKRRYEQFLRLNPLTRMDRRKAFLLSLT